MHFNVRPSGERDRVCTCKLFRPKHSHPLITPDVCMAPAALLSDEDRAIRIACFEKYHGTTHVPFAAIFSREHEPAVRDDGKPCAHDTGRPKNPPVHTEKLLKLVGSVPY
jgi:hypothetical protein